MAIYIDSKISLFVQRPKHQGIYSCPEKFRGNYGYPEIKYTLKHILSAKRKYYPKLVNIFANSQYFRLKFSPLSLNIAFYLNLQFHANRSMVKVLTLSRGQNIIFEWKSVMLILILILDCRLKSVTFMPVFPIYFHFYKTHIATSRTHQHYCDQAMGMLKTSNSVNKI